MTSSSKPPSFPRGPLSRPRPEPHNRRYRRHGPSRTRPSCRSCPRAVFGQCSVVQQSILDSDFTKLWKWEIWNDFDQEFKKFLLWQMNTTCVPASDRRETAWYSCFVGPPASPLPPWRPQVKAYPLYLCHPVKGKKPMPRLTVLFACHAQSYLKCIDFLNSPACSWWYHFCAKSAIFSSELNLPTMSAQWALCPFLKQGSWLKSVS